MMITRCPSCATDFRITPEQLKAMHGKVRCGRCKHVFNAIDSLVDMVAEPSLATAVPEDVPAPGAPAEEPADIEEAEQDVEVDLPTVAEPRIEPTIDGDWPAAEIEPLLHETDEAAPRRRAWPWLLAVLAALLLMLTQAAIYFRVELSVLLPASKPFLAALCSPLGCDVPLPRKGDLISIESSDLRPAAKNPGQLLLAATLKNRAPFAQAYPDLELTLTDTADQAIVRKVLLPSDYLPKGVDLAAGFAARGEVALALALNHERAGNAAATGYRLYLFYP